MAPRLGQAYGVEVEIIVKTREAYRSASYSKTKLPAAPAIMVGDEIVVQGRDISDEEIVEILSSRL